MDINKEREAFEKHASKFFITNEAFEDDGENYVYDEVKFMWDCWLAAKAQAVPEWISVKNKLPKIGVYVMVFLEKQGHNPTTYNFCQYTKFGFHLSNVTHWMPLPDAPQEPAND